jgi:carboxyl-terminal processing protease
MHVRTANRLPLIAAALLLIASVSAAQRTNDFAARFELVWTTTKQRFYDKNMNGADWDAVGRKYRDEAAGAKNRAEFKAIVNRMLGDLHASHTGYFTDDDLDYHLLKTLFQNDYDSIRVEHIGVLGSDVDGVYAVQAALDGSPAEKAGIRPGDRILDADGQRFTAVGSFKGRAGMEVRLTIERPGREKLTVTVTPVRQNPQRAFLEATEKSARIITRGAKRFGYFHLWTMTSDRMREAMDVALTGKLASTDGLVLDLRDGYGGHPAHFTDVLFRPDVRWSQTGRDGRTSGYQTAYGKPIVVLINKGTRSAKEWFAYQIKKTGRGPLVGTNTAGAFLGAGGFATGTDGYLELPVVDLALDGKRLEGVGVAPDVVVEADDTYGPNDAQLARALELLEERVK